LRRNYNNSAIAISLIPDPFHVYLSNGRQGRRGDEEAGRRSGEGENFIDDLKREANSYYTT